MDATFLSQLIYICVQQRRQCNRWRVSTRAVELGILLFDCLP